MRAGGDALQQQAARQGNTSHTGLSGGEPGPSVDTQVVRIARVCGEPELALRVLSPTCPETSGANTPIMVAPHGGGYVAGRAHFDDERNAMLARELGVRVVSPEYRLTPEHPFPAGRDDVVAAFEWAQQAYPSAPLLGFGDSAGSGLLYSAVVEYLLQGGAQVSACVYLEPCIDPLLQERSMQTCADGPIWTLKAARHAWAAYCAGADPAEVMPNVQAAAVRLADADRCLPASFVVVNPVDPLRDEGIRFACDLVDAGVEAQLHMWEGTFHGSLGYPVASWHEMNSSIKRFFSKRG